jgi:hypothetical protein
VLTKAAGLAPGDPRIAAQVAQGPGR